MVFEETLQILESKELMGHVKNGVDLVDRVERPEDYDRAGKYDPR